MKTARYILIYDDKCPICAAYTRLFVKTGILNNDGRISFIKANTGLLERFDIDRGKNEIPLLDTSTGKVHYGIDALLELLNTRIPIIKGIGRFKPVYWFLRKLYKFISFNRKVIVAVKCNKGQFDCSPEFNYKWRLLFMLFFLCFNTAALIPVQQYALANSIFSNASLEYLQVLHIMLVGSNVLLALTMTKTEAFEYLGQVNILATIAVLFLLLLAGFNRFIIASPIINNLYLFAILLLIVKEYIRRMNYAGTFSNIYITATNIFCIVAFLTLMII